MESEVINEERVLLSPKKNSDHHRYSMALIWLCWLVYSCANIGKTTYAANINQIMDFYSVDHAEAGLVGTFLFFAYGAGQFFNGAFCKKYNLRFVIFASVFISGMINFVVFFKLPFSIVKYLWLINGFLLSMLWPSVIRLLTQTLTPKYMARAGVILGATVAAGTVLTYGSSAIFTAVGNFRLTFLIFGIFMPLVALVWFFTSPKLIKNIKSSLSSSNNENSEEIGSTKKALGASENTGYGKRVFLLSIITLSVFALFGNLIKDGLTTWVPAILKEEYNVAASFSIILTLALPFVSLFSNAFAVYFSKKQPDFVLQCSLMFVISGVVIGAVIGGLSLSWFWLTLIGFTLVSFLLAASHSAITSVFPLFMRGENAGTIAGLVDGFAYIGSAISAYGLGALADRYGWNIVFWVLLAICLLCCLVGVLYTVLKKRFIKKNIK